VSELLLLAYESVGVIYGDIGTSPLYVFSSTFYSAPSRADVRGALSLIIWSLTVIVTLKYVLIILRADNDGEGGTFSTYSLLSRYVSKTQMQQGCTERNERKLMAIGEYFKHGSSRRNEVAQIKGFVQVSSPFTQVALC
jgi:KUP system potassium uptake protein